ncbi:MAG: TVP38/TMEM64 family protein [Phycisphaerales bacterium JB052]
MPENTTEPVNEPTPSESQESIGDIIKRLGPAAWLGIAWAVFPGVMGILLLTNMDFATRLLKGTETEPGLPLFAGLGVYVAIFIISAGLGLLPTYSQAILAGFAFGIAWGFPAALVGFGGASIIGYFIANRVARKKVEAEIHHHPKAEIVRDAFIRHGFMRALLILTLLRVPPNSPFALMNYVMSVSGVRLVPFLIATIVGMAPRTFAAVWIGSQVSSWDEVEKPKWLIIGGIVLAIAILVGLGKLANKAIEQAMRSGQLPDHEPHPPAEPPEKGSF